MIIGCNLSSENERSTTAKPIPANSVDTTYVVRTYTLNSSFLAGGEDGIDTTNFTAIYPHFEEKWINKIIEEQFLNASPVEDLGESFIVGYEEFVEDESITYYHSWFDRLKIQVDFISTQLLSLSMEREEYTGGAHGLYHQHLLNVDMLSRKVLEIGDIVKENEYSNFEKTAECVFRKDEGLMETESLEEKYFFSNGIFSLPESFALTAHGLLFVYNPYAIKPYSEGVTHLFIPYNLIDAVLTEKATDLINNFNTQQP